MTAEEIIKEYKADYEKCLRPKLLALATRKTHDLKIFKGKWIPVKEEIKIKSTTGNNYKIKCKLRWDKRRGSGWSTVIYLSTSDSKTGKEVVYILSDTLPIKLSPSFLREIKTSVSEFLGHGANWDILTGPDGDKRYSAYINFGENIGAGVGGWESGVFVLRHLVENWEIDPISEFLESRQNIDESEEKEDISKKSEIDLAWEEYLSGNLE